MNQIFFNSIGIKADIRLVIYLWKAMLTDIDVNIIHNWIRYII